MPINGSDWYEKFKVLWKEGPARQVPLDDTEYRIKIMEARHAALPGQGIQGFGRVGTSYLDI